MGYCIDATVNDVVIPGAKVEGAVAALTELMDEAHVMGEGGSWQGGQRHSAHFSWVNTDEVLGHLARKDLAKAIESWRWACGAPDEKDDLEILADAYVPHQDVKVDYFAGEKMGQDDVFWETLAPFVQEGAMIEFRGEDDARWRYIFTGDGMKVQTGETVWKEQ